jgi:hypothetical protein
VFGGGLRRRGVLRRSVLGGCCFKEDVVLRRMLF